MKMNSRFESLKEEGFVQYKSKREKKESKREPYYPPTPKPKPIPKLNIHDGNQFPELNVSNVPTTSKLNFGNLFHKVKKTKKTKMNPNCVRWYKVNGQYHAEKGDMTGYNQMVVQKETDRVDKQLQHICDAIELTTENLKNYLGEEEYNYMYEGYEMCESIQSLSECSDSESDYEEIDEGDESNRGLE